LTESIQRHIIRSTKKEAGVKRFLTVLGFALLTLLAIGCTRKVVIYEQAPAPPPRVEVYTVAPFKGAVWAPGHWAWKGRYRGWVWRSGHWRR